MTRQKKTIICPLGGAGVGGKWMFWIWFHLLNETRRFGELQRLIPQASRQMLTIELRELEKMGVIYRKVSVQGPLKVEYGLTEMGQRSKAQFYSFYAWGKSYCNETGLAFDDLLVNLGSRWTFWIWFHLLNGPRRFSELQRLLPQASRRMLVMQLQKLEQMEVIHRNTPINGPLKVEYELTELGQRSGPIFRELCSWGKWYCNQLGLAFDWSASHEMEEVESHSWVGKDAES